MVGVQQILAVSYDYHSFSIKLLTSSTEIFTLPRTYTNYKSLIGIELN